VSLVLHTFPVSSIRGSCVNKVYILLDAGGVVLLVLLILIALMVWRWRVHKDPLPPRARTVLNRTFHRKRNADNELYGANSQPTARHNSNVIPKLYLFLFIL